MTVNEKGHPQELMAEIARVVREWAHGPMLSETALSEIRAILAAEAAKTAEGAVAWVVRLPGPSGAIKFETDTDLYGDPANRYGGDWTPLYAAPPPTQVTHE